MLKTRLIPIVLFSGYQLVKTKRFENPRTVGNPLQIVRMFNAREVDELVFLDIVATGMGAPPAYSIIERVAGECFMPLTVGGGIRHLGDIEKLLQMGADKIAMNTMALEEPGFINRCARVFGSQTIVVSIDVRRTPTGWEVLARNGTTPTGRDLKTWCQEVSDRGAGEILLTSIDEDGMQAGYDVEMIRHASGSVSIPVLANGGAGSPEDVVACAKVGQPSAVCASSLFFFTQFSPRAVKQCMKDSGLNVRL